MGRFDPDLGPCAICRTICGGYLIEGDWIVGYDCKKHSPEEWSEYYVKKNKRRAMLDEAKASLDKRRKFARVNPLDLYHLLMGQL